MLALDLPKNYIHAPWLFIQDGINYTRLTTTKKINLNLFGNSL